MKNAKKWLSLLLVVLTLVTSISPIIASAIDTQEVAVEQVMEAEPETEEPKEAEEPTVIGAEENLVKEVFEAVIEDGVITIVDEAEPEPIIDEEKDPTLETEEPIEELEPTDDIDLKIEEETEPELEEELEPDEIQETEADGRGFLLLTSPTFRYASSPSTVRYSMTFYYSDDKTYSNGIPAICIEPDAPISATDSYVAGSPSTNAVWDSYGFERKHMISITQLYGQVNEVGDKYVALQVLIREICTGKVKSDWSGTNSETGRLTANQKSLYNDLVSKCKKHDMRPSFHNANVTLVYNSITKKYEATLNDTNNALSQFAVSSQGGVNYEVNGNTLKISSDTPLSSEQQAIFWKAGIPTSSRSMMVLSSQGRQTCAIGAENDPVPFRINVSTEASCSVEIEKQVSGYDDGRAFRFYMDPVPAIRPAGMDESGLFFLKGGQKLKVTGLPADGTTYTVTEGDNGSLYAISTPSQSVTLDGAKTEYFIKFVNTRITGKLLVKKTVIDNSGEPEVGKKFPFKIDPVPPTLPTGVKTDGTFQLAHDEIIEFEVPWGVEYKVKELYTGNDYVVVTSEQSKTLYSEYHLMEFVNVRRMVDFTVGKAVFGEYFAEQFDMLLKINGHPYTGKAIINEEEVIIFDGTFRLGKNDTAIFSIPYGAAYEVTETPHKLYEAKQETFKGTVVEGETVVFENTRIPVIVPLSKVELTTLKGLGGAVVTVADFDTKEEIFRGITPVSGILEFECPKVGKYIYKEETPPTGYILNKTEFIFEVHEDGTVTGDTTITNEPITVIISKEDVTNGKKLPNAEITIKNENDEIVFTGITDEDGNIYFEKPSPQKYTFVETASPDGYKLNTTIFEFVVHEDGTITGDNTITDEPIVVIISKEDVTNGKKLPNAEITIKNENDEIVFTGITDEDGNIYFEKPSPQKYTFVETASPDGYKLNTTIFEFVVHEDGTITGDNTITDEPTEVILYKKDADDKKGLAGSVYTITNESGESFDTEPSDETGEIHLNYLPAGVYQFKEKTAPNGYELNKETYSFTIQADGSVTGDNTILNMKTPVTPPKTGIDNTFIIVLALVTLTGSITAGFILSKKEKKRNDQRNKERRGE